MPNHPKAKDQKEHPRNKRRDTRLYDHPRGCPAAAFLPKSGGLAFRFGKKGSIIVDKIEHATLFRKSHHEEDRDVAMSTEKKYRVPDDKYQRSTLQSGERPIRYRRDTPDLRPASRNLRKAVLLLAKKVESLGVDVSEVTELIGVDKD